MEKAIEGLRKTQSRAVTRRRLLALMQDGSYLLWTGDTRVRITFSERKDAPAIEDGLVNILKRRMG